ncbi:thiol reductant ABC exporter subunit CydD [Alkalicoccus saliphilus]|uniref:Thiol reductant ABC exporter subunit CydD n=1 Tax=Alkalicoccus saliphilus TaxID=200989 RepID=A0A2T4U705_9BACI|nr:thiol reductant ABC exporter subunit CydD [Alkalicoccus saliphilus]PTL39180.1 thiol reductant ABC exporter subunit CydD [Alkalicoccus saliphilus]
MTAKERLKELSKQNKKSRYLLMLVSTAVGLTIVAQAYFIVAVVDQIFLQGASVSDIYVELAGVMGALGLRAALQYVNNRTGEKMAAEVKQEFRRKLLKKYTENPVQASAEGRSGSKVSVMLDAVDELDAYFSHYYVVMMQSSLVPLILLGAVFYMNWVSGLILLITAPFIPIMMIVIGKNTQKKSEEQMEKLNAFSGKFLDILQGLSTLKLFGRARKQEIEIEKSSLNYRDATMSVLKIAFLSSLMLEFISMLSVSIVALEVGLRLVIYDQLSFFTAFFVLILVPEFFASLKEMGSAFHSGRGSMAAADRIYAELDKEEQPVTWGEKEAPAVPSVTFKETRFQYDTDRFALGPLDAHLEAGTHTAVIGRSGSGKSTLLQLISGLMPAEGEILVNGTPMTEIKEASWYDQLAYVTQKPYLFSGTLRENVVLGKPDVSKEELETAVEKAGLKEVASALPNGLDTMVGEGGRGLSGGEKQRVALARAFIKKPGLLLFDEPTTGLDVKTEQLLQRGMKELSENATVLTVAHRLHTIREADQILLLENGRIAAAGTHGQLLEKNESYRDMVQVQQGVKA